MTHSQFEKQNSTKQNSRGQNGDSRPGLFCLFVYTSLHIVAQLVKNLPAMQETWLRSLGGEDPLRKGMANLSRILAWRIPWAEEPGGLQSLGVTMSWTQLSDK